MSLQAYLDQMQNPQAKVLGSFNSIEGLVRSVLGEEFRESPKKETAQPTPILEKKTEPLSLHDDADFEAIVEQAIAKATAKKTVEPPAPVYSEPEPINEEVKPINLHVNRKNEYILHRDADEIFECTVNIEGGTDKTSKARLILKTDTWNLMFEGSIKRNGTCVIPIKKLHILPEGTTGEAFLEVVVDDILFIPWERPFSIAMSKKVSVDNAHIK